MENGTYNNGTFPNDSNNNTVCCKDVMPPFSPTSAVFAFRFTLASSMISSVYITMACASIFVNSLFLWAIARVDNSELKAKRLIVNLSIANMSVPVLLALDPYFISAIVSMTRNIVSPNICVLGVYTMFGMVIICGQAASVLGLAFDRIYAVARPLTYSTTGYSGPMGTLILFLPGICGLLIWSTFMFLSWSKLPLSEHPGVPMFCQHLLNAYLLAEGTKVLDSLFAGANVFSFLVYISIFVILKYKERTIQNLSMTTGKKTTLSLARTYFLINVTTLALYLPAPIFSILTESATGESLTTGSANIASALLILYVGNTCLDPIILISRIPSVRRHLPIRLLNQEETGMRETELPCQLCVGTQLKRNSSLSP